LNIIWYIFILLSLTVLFSLLFGSILKGRKGRFRYDKERQKTGSKTCPICGSVLKKGEKIHSIVFTGKKTSIKNVGGIGSGDKVIHIYGCPYCYPIETGVKRICPVCKKEIPDSGYLIGRIWNRKGKIHLHILGCTQCAVNTIEK